ncbi:MAG: hypothetical protein ACTSXD_02030 [Candidatus Heimdallarchaeaceae archaeon]
MNKVEQLLKSINELANPHYFSILKDLKDDISTKDNAINSLSHFIKKNKTNRYYLDALNWLKKLTDKEYLKLYKLYKQGK